MRNVLYSQEHLSIIPAQCADSVFRDHDIHQLRGDGWMNLHGSRWRWRGRLPLLGSSEDPISWTDLGKAWEKGYRYQLPLRLFSVELSLS